MFKQISDRHKLLERGYSLNKEAKMEFNRINAKFKDKSNNNNQIMFLISYKGGSL